MSIDSYELELAEIWQPPTMIDTLGWLPVAGDWDGDLIDDVGLLDPARREFHLWRKVPAGGWAGLPAFQVPVAGQGGWPLAGDWDGDGDAEVGLYLAEESRFLLLEANAPDAAVNDFVFETPGGSWLPVAGRWTSPSHPVDTVGLYGPADPVMLARYTNDAGGADQIWNLDLPPDLLPIAAHWGEGDGFGFYDPVSVEFVIYASIGEGAGDTIINRPPPLDPRHFPNPEW